MQSTSQPRSASKHQALLEHVVVVTATRTTTTAPRVPGRPLDAMLRPWGDGMFASLRFSLSFLFRLCKPFVVLFYLSEFFHLTIETQESIDRI